MTSKKLELTEVVVTSSIKFFGLDAGQSTESNVGMRFRVPEGLSKAEVAELVRAEKFELDCQVLTMEYDRGSINKRQYGKALKILEESYEDD